IDVANGENSRDGTGKAFGVDGNQPVLERQAPIGNRTELHGQAEEGQQARGRDALGPARTVYRHRRQEPVLAFERRDLTLQKTHAARLDQIPHAPDAVRSGAEFWPPVDKRNAARGTLEIQCPVECRVAAAGDDDVLTGKGLDPPYGVEDAAALIL